MRRKNAGFLLVVGLVWILVVGAGLGMLQRYENTPSLQATPGKRWPANLPFAPASDKPTLVMLAHPRCPCTRASIGELARLMTRCQGKLSAKVLFFTPKGAEAQWARTDLWHSAAAIPGVEVVADAGGTLAAQHFHAATSGQTLLYDAMGRLLFCGGITEARGHAGDNAGAGAIASLVTTGTAQQTKTAVFGCSLLSPSSPPKGP